MFPCVGRVPITEPLGSAQKIPEKILQKEIKKKVPQKKETSWNDDPKFGKKRKEKKNKLKL